MKKYNQAINEILQVLGEQIVEGDLSIEGIYEAEQADLNIEIVKEEILSEGWSFNTDTNWEFSPDTDNYIVIPTTVLRVDPSVQGNDIIRKDGKLYDKGNFTYKFNTSVSCDVIWNLDFDDLPLIAQRYITLRAARITYQRLIGDNSTLEILLRDEDQALLKLRQHEDDIQDYNIFDDTTVSRIITRTANPTGIRG